MNFKRYFNFFLYQPCGGGTGKGVLKLLPMSLAYQGSLIMFSTCCSVYSAAENPCRVRPKCSLFKLMLWHTEHRGAISETLSRKENVRTLQNPQHRGVTPNMIIRQGVQI